MLNYTKNVYDKWGIIDDKMNVIIPFVYGNYHIDSTIHKLGYYIFSHNKEHKTWLLINVKNEIIIPEFIFLNIEYLTNVILKYERKQKLKMFL